VERALSNIESTTGQGLASACWPGTDCHDDITSTGSPHQRKNAVSTYWLVCQKVTPIHTYIVT